jgi:methyltransferase (TIGR00027 family)
VGASKKYMEKGQPSLTAYRVAMSRAVHQILDDPKVLDDPVALRIISALSGTDTPLTSRQLETKPARYLRAFVAARSRVAEDALVEAITRGIRQYVILGAGLDTFAYRNPYPMSSLSVFEVDHPTTQAWKRSQLSLAQIAIPESLTFVPIDFETQSLADRMRESGFRADEPSFFSWLGVTMYVTRGTVMSTMKYVASSIHRGSGIVFDYAISPSAPSTLMRIAAAAGEPWQTFFDRSTLTDELKALGFECVEDVGPEEINARLFADRADGLRVAGFGRLITAFT